MVQVQASHVPPSMQSAAPTAADGGRSGGGGCRSNQQIAAAWAWFEHAGQPRAAVLAGPACRQSAARRPSRFKQEFLASARPPENPPFGAARRRRHSFGGGAGGKAAPRRCGNHDWERGDTPAPPASEKAPSDRGDGVEVSRLFDEFEVESLCRQLRRQCHQALHSATEPPPSSYTAVEENDSSEFSAPYLAEQSSDQDLLRPDSPDESGRRRWRSASMRKSHSMSNFMSALLHLHVSGADKPRGSRHRPLICSSIATIDSFRTNSHGRSTPISPVASRSMSKAKQRTALQQNDSADMEALAATHSRSADELDPQEFHTHGHVHHHLHFHHHHHVLHRKSDSTLRRLECTVHAGREGEKMGTPLVLSTKRLKLENERIQLQLRGLLAGQRYYVDEKNTELPDDLKYDHAETNDHSVYDECFNYKAPSFAL